MNMKLSLNEFTESVAGMMEYNDRMQFTNEKEYKHLLKILAKMISGELTERQQQCIVMRYYKNLTVTEIAAQLGIGKSTASRHIKKAKMRLYRLLDYYILSK